MTFGEQRTGVALTLNSESAGTEMVRHLPQNALFLALMGRSPDPTVSGGIKGSHFRRAERVPAEFVALPGHTSGPTAGRDSGSRRSDLFPDG